MKKLGICYAKSKHYENFDRLFPAIIKVSRRFRSASKEKAKEQKEFGGYETASKSDEFAAINRRKSYDRVDLIGPPDPVSNLRKVVFSKPAGESNLEKSYREARESTQAWNQDFWRRHNSNFVNERKEFQRVAREKSGQENVTADEMSVFYKNFLDKNWKSHLHYNVNWYKRNFKILVLELRIRLSKMKLR